MKSADKIAVGQWVRLYALAKSPAKRRSRMLLDAPAAAASTQPIPAEPGFLPMSPALARAAAAAAATYEELEDEMRAARPWGPGASGGGVFAAAQQGTLDAYLYGENLVNSGTSAWGWDILGLRCMNRALHWTPAIAAWRAACSRIRRRQPPPPWPLLADSFPESDHVRFLVKVVEKGKDWVRLERPLPYDMRVRWQVRASARCRRALRWGRGGAHREVATWEEVTGLGWQPAPGCARREPAAAARVFAALPALLSPQEFSTPTDAAP